jgi:hypothetical protein
MLLIVFVVKVFVAVRNTAVFVGMALALAVMPEGKSDIYVDPNFVERLAECWRIRPEAAAPCSATQ